MQNPDPSHEELNDFIDWMEENNDIDLNQVKFRIRELEDGAGAFAVTVEWQNRERNDCPRASELLPKAGWVIESWFWNGQSWVTGFWRDSQE